MVEPYEFRVLANLKAALQAATVAAGFFYGIDDAAVLLDPETDVETLIAPGGPRPFVVIELKDEVWEYLASGECRITLPAFVTWVHDGVPPEDAATGVPSPPSSEYRMKVYHRGCADVERAITADGSRGGLAVDTRITNRTWMPGRSGQEVVAALEIEIGVYRGYGQPV